MVEGETAVAAPVRHDFEFRGRGGEFFRIWILNLALTLLTFGIYSAWAKVRTRRYLYGNTYIAGHALDYDPSPWRILIGRAIALAFFLAYSVSVGVWPQALGLWYIAFGFTIPWLIHSSLRFSARNNSYRNKRFTATPCAPHLEFAIPPLYLAIYLTASTFIDTMVFNLSLNKATFDTQHELRSRLSPWVMSWIVFSNLVLMLLPVGLFYPWAMVRQTRYETTRLSLIAATDLDEYTSALGRARSAVGEEVAGFFDLGIGL